MAGRDAVLTNPAVDFTPANYCYKMVLHDATAPSLVVETEAEVVDAVVDAPAAPQTFDAGVIAAVAAIVSAAGYAISKKR